MARSSQGFAKKQSSSYGVTALVAFCLALGWVWLVAGTRLHEMIVGSVAVALSTSFLYVVHRSKRGSIKLHEKDVLEGWRIPGYLVQDTALVTVALVKDFLHVQPAGSHYRLCGFKSQGQTPEAVARGVLATLYVTSTPNGIVVGIDCETGKMVFHQLEHSSLPSMARALGAEP